jgi:hypothetical protein
VSSNVCLRHRPDRGPVSASIYSVINSKTNTRSGRITNIAFLLFVSVSGESFSFVYSHRERRQVLALIDVVLSLGGVECEWARSDTPAGISVFSFVILIFCIARSG